MTNKALPLHMISATPSAIPTSFGGDLSLFGLNLFLMTAMTFFGAMMALSQGARIWQQRFLHHPLDPVTLYRLITMLAGAAVMLRCGGEALLLWGWNPLDPNTTARVIMAKRWIDPIALGLGFVWMCIVKLGEPGIEFQLTKTPLPVDMWSRWPALMRAMGVVALSLVMALAAVVLR